MSAAPYRRLGVVTARKLDATHEWLTSEGSELRGERGDWLVVDAAGVERTVSAAQFPQMYRPLGGGRFRRSGTVLARRATAEEVVDTLEGAALARPGMWVLTDAAGGSWPVPDNVFRAGYEPSPLWAAADPWRLDARGRLGAAAAAGRDTLELGLVASRRNELAVTVTGGSPAWTAALLPRVTWGLSPTLLGQVATARTAAPAETAERFLIVDVVGEGESLRSITPYRVTTGTVSWQPEHLELTAEQALTRALASAARADPAGVPDPDREGGPGEAAFMTPDQGRLTLDIGTLRWLERRAAEVEADVTVAVPESSLAEIRGQLLGWADVVAG